MRRQRDFKKEYQRRIANAAKRGLSRSQARGHARAGETPIRPVARFDDAISADLQLAIRTLREEGTIAAAAKASRISRERLSRFLHENALIERSTGRTWRVTDNFQWHVPVTSDGATRIMHLTTFADASLTMRHQAAIEAYLDKHDIELLAPFIGQSISDAKGVSHMLETDPNALHRLAAAGSEPFHNVYRLTL